MAKCGEDRTLLTVSDQNCSLICLDLLGHTDLLEKQVYAGDLVSGDGVHRAIKLPRFETVVVIQWCIRVRPGRRSPGKAKLGGGA